MTHVPLDMHGEFPPDGETLHPLTKSSHDGQELAATHYDAQRGIQRVERASDIPRAAHPASLDAATVMIRKSKAA